MPEIGVSDFWNMGWDWRWFAAMIPEYWQLISDSAHSLLHLPFLRRVTAPPILQQSQQEKVNPAMSRFRAEIAISNTHWNSTWPSFGHKDGKSINERSREELLLFECTDEQVPSAISLNCSSTICIENRKWIYLWNNVLIPSLGVWKHPTSVLLFLDWNASIF